MKEAKLLIARLRSRLAQDKLTYAEFTMAVAEVLAATTERLSAADSLMISREIRELEQAWRESAQAPSK